MSRPRKKNKSNNTQNRKKPVYKGPFQTNPNLEVQNVRKSMRPENEGPTVDTFSEMDSTTSVLPNEENDIRDTSGIKRPTKEKRFTISTENLFFAIFGFVAIGIGILVFSHGNRFVSVEKDIEYIQKDIVEQKATLEKIDDKTDNIERKVDLINQKIELEKKEKNNR